MGSWKAIFIVLIFHAICSWNHANAVIQPKEYEPSGGGGDCDTDLDCNLKGTCVNEDAKDEDPSKGDDDEINGKCVCETGRDGKNCEKEDKKPSRREVIYGLRKTQKRVEKRQLKFDGDLKATGLDPEEVATAGQSFLLFNPKTQRYVRVSTDHPKLGKEKANKYLVTDPDYRGASKLFKLESAGGDDYFIQARDDDDKSTVGYVYWSEVMKGVRKKSNRIMVSAKRGTGDEYKFSFVKNPEQNGVYKIRCKGMTLYGSVGGHNIKADKRTDREKSEEIWFQINLKADSAISMKITNTKKDALSRDDDLEIEHEEYNNDNSEDQKITLNKETTKSKVLTKFDKIAATGTAGAKVGAFGNLGISISKERSTTDQYTLTKIGKSGIELTVKGNSKVCVEYSFRLRSRYDEDELEISFKGKKFKGYKLKEQKSQGDVTFAVKKVGVTEECQ